MKLGNILTAVDSNPNYLSFVPIFIKSWRLLFPNSNVYVILIHDNIPYSLKDYKENIILFKPIKNFPSSSIAQLIRLYYPCLIDSDNALITTDIDMIPLSKNYYNEIIESNSSDQFIVFRNILNKKLFKKFSNKQYPICYLGACPRIWKSIFRINSSDDIRKIFVTKYKKLNHTINKKGDDFWYDDQKEIFQKLFIFKKSGGSVKIYRDRDTLFNRLCRDNFNENLIDYYRKKIQLGTYTDFHMLNDSRKKFNNLIFKYLEESAKE